MKHFGPGSLIYLISLSTTPIRPLQVSEVDFQGLATDRRSQVPEDHCRSLSRGRRAGPLPSRQQYPPPAEIPPGFKCPQGAPKLVSRQ